jgi:hypothetical protein
MRADPPDLGRWEPRIEVEVVASRDWNGQDKVLNLAQILAQEVDQKSGAIIQSLFELWSRKMYHVGSKEGIQPEMDAPDAGTVE